MVTLPSPRPTPPGPLVAGSDLLRSWWSSPRLRAGALAGLSLAAALLWYRGGTEAERVDRAGLARLVDAGPPGESPRGDRGPASAASAPFVVHVAGAVVRPGLVRLAPGSRVADAVSAAGGPRPEADLDRLNLAARVLDGQRIAVIRRGEGPPEGDGSSLGEASATEGTIDLNAATAAQLDSLPGVGPATARAIIGYRERHGGFRSLRQLLDVGGIGERRLEELAGLVRV